MAVVHAVGATILNRLKMAFDAGAITPAAGASLDAAAGVGVLILGTSSLAGGTAGVIVSFSLQKPSFSYSGSAATLLGVPLSASATATATIAKAELRDSAGVVIVNGLTVGTSGSDINLNSLAASSGVQITVTSLVVTGT
jgi:hypothetical protein